MTRRAGLAIALATVAGTGVIAASAGGGTNSGASMSGDLARGTGMTLRATIQNDGGVDFQFGRFAVNAEFRVLDVTIVNGPDGANCNPNMSNVQCAFNPNTFQPGQTLVFDITTDQLYPDNGGMQAFGCPNPCMNEDVGPFQITGPPPPGMASGTIPAGFDLFETDPASTIFRFNGPTEIPAGFFGPGSEAFRGTVNFAGQRIEMFDGMPTGDADTVVRRQSPIQLFSDQPSDPIPIQIVELSLVSVEPIKVPINGADSFFDVFVELSPSRSSPGQMTAMGDPKTGGTFESQLQVFPLFTFVPLDGGEPRVLDVGAVDPTPELAEALTLRQEGGVWAPGCAPPALLIPGLNDVFCPGLTPALEKKLTLEASALAQHGVYPVQDALEHFACYAVRTEKRFRRRGVRLLDQFGTKRTRVLRPKELCNPAQKNGEAFTNDEAHLQCYGLRRSKLRMRVAVRNQFGSQRLRTKKSERLCVPSLKYKRKPTKNAVTFTDHFHCYSVRKSGFEQRTVKVEDQFGARRMEVKRPWRLCNPAQKNDEASAHPVQHLVCYRVEPKGRFRDKRVFVRNQYGTQRVRAVRPLALCVPSAKVEVDT